MRFQGRENGSRRVCVTGGAGFIGSHLVDALVARGDDVRVIDDCSTGAVENLSHYSGRINFTEASILNRAALRRSFEGCEIVFHLAAYVSAPGSVRDPESCHAINATGTLEVLEAARACSVQRVVMASSSAVYGGGGSKKRSESDPIQPESPYGMSKAVGELMLQTWARCHGLETVALRLFNVYGPRQSGSSAYAAVVAAFMSALTAGRNVTIYGDGAQTRDFIYVKDVAEAFIQASRMPLPESSEILNVGRGKSVSVLDLAAMVADAVDATPPAIVFESARDGDIAHSCADIGRMRAHAGNEPNVSMPEGLRETVAWYQERTSASQVVS